MASLTTVYGVVGAVGTGVAAFGGSLVALEVAFPSASHGLALAGAVFTALGGAVSLVAKTLGGLATPDKPAGGS